MVRPIRVIVVDDSPIMRALISRTAEKDGDIKVVATVGDSAAARAAIKELEPDVITLDVEMPGMNGIEFLKKIMELRPMPVVMVSSLTDAGTDIAVQALEIGATDALPKPGQSTSVNAFGTRLRAALRAGGGARMRPKRPVPHRPVLKDLAEPLGTSPDVIVLGASTGGVSAIGDILSALPALPVPMVIVQHMPDIYVERFALRLNKMVPHDVALARDGERIRPGCVRIAPGRGHVRISGHKRSIVTEVASGPPVSGHCPSVDVLFRSAATLNANVLGVLLTGMGKDGASGLCELRSMGAWTLAQDEATSVVFGMPRVAIEGGGACETLPLPAIGPHIFTLCKGSRVKLAIPQSERDLSGNAQSKIA